MPRGHGQAVYDAVYKMHLEGVPHKEIADRLSLPVASVHTIVYRCKHGVAPSNRELDAKHEERCEELRAERSAATTWMEHIKPLHEHKKRLEAEVAAKAEELRQAREALDSYLATLKELMGGA